MESILQLNSDMHVPYLVSISPGAVLFGLLSDREVESEEDGERRGVTRTEVGKLGKLSKWLMVRRSRKTRTICH